MALVWRRTGWRNGQINDEFEVNSVQEEGLLPQPELVKVAAASELPVTLAEIEEAITARDVAAKTCFLSLAASLTKAEAGPADQSLTQHPGPCRPARPRR